MTSQSSSAASAAALARLVDRVMESDEIVGDVAAEDGSTYRIVRRPHPGPVVTMMPIAPRFAPPLEVRTFAVRDERPVEYPASVPVVLGSRVVIMAALDGSQRHVTWSGLADPVSAAAEIERQCLDDGWERTETGNPIVSLRRATSTRILLHGPPLENGQLQMLEFSDAD